MNRKPVFTICFVASVLIFGGFQLWAEGPTQAGAEAAEVIATVNGFEPDMAQPAARTDHDLGDGLRAVLSQPTPGNLSSFDLTVTNTSDERVKCAVDIQMEVEEQSFASRVPKAPTVLKRSDRMIVWLAPGESKTRTVKTKVYDNAIGTSVDVTLRRNRTVIPGALTMGIIAPSRPMELRLIPNEIRELPMEPAANAVLPAEVFGVAPTPVAAN